MEFSISEPQDLGEFLDEMVKLADSRKVWVFKGEMGAGKTTLIKEICDYLGVVDTMSSPTFSLINVYQNGLGEELYHFDFYRIEQQQEAIDIGSDEYFYSGNYCFIEWPERIPDLLPDEYLKICIKLDQTNRRIISLSLDD